MHKSIRVPDELHGFCVFQVMLQGQTLSRALCSVHKVALWVLMIQWWYSNQYMVEELWHSYKFEFVPCKDPMNDS